MAEWVEFKAKTVSDAVKEAILKFNTTEENLQYEVVEKETNGILGFFSKQAKIRAKIKEVKEVVEEKNTVVEKKQKSTVDTSTGEVAEKFLKNVLHAMNIPALIEVNYKQDENTMDITLEGDDMGILIGKRGQTLDSLQYLTSLAVNKESSSYVKVTLDTENYRERRKETLENLAKNIAYKVKRTKHSVSLEPMNPYERRIIHSALQYDKYIETHSEGDEPYRHVVISLKRGYRDYNRSNAGRSYNNKNYKNSSISDSEKVE